MWARDIGHMAGVAVPLHACEHFYIVTEAMPDLRPICQFCGCLTNVPIIKRTLEKFFLARLNQIQNLGA